MHTQGRQRFSSQGLRGAPTFKTDQPSQEMVSQLCLPLTSPPERTPSPPSCDPTHPLPGSHLSTSVNTCYAICPQQYNSAQLSGREEEMGERQGSASCLQASTFPVIYPPDRFLQAGCSSAQEAFSLQRFKHYGPHPCHTNTCMI